MLSTAKISLDETFTFDDVCLVPGYSEVLPADVDVSTEIGRGVKLNVPLLSAAMDTVTLFDTAIAMAQCGGVGIIHKNLSPQLQAQEVRRVKKYEAGIVQDPLTITKQHRVEEAIALMRRYQVGSFPVMEGERLVGIVTRRDMAFAASPQLLVEQVMSKEVISAKENTSFSECLELMRRYKIEKLPLVDDEGALKGLITMKDLQRSQTHPLAVCDDKGRLLCGAAIGPSADMAERAEQLVDAGVDLLIVDTAHGHSLGVVNCVRSLRSSYPHLLIGAGNLVTAEAALCLAEAGADLVKVGIGPGSICTTRIVAGVGVPQLSAVYGVCQAVKHLGVKVIADGGIKYSGDVVKAMAVGANAVMIGSLFAGTDEAPGEQILYEGRAFKVYRGMGSLDAMMQGSKDRYGQAKVKERDKLVPEGIEGRVPYRGSLESVIFQLIGGLRSGMGYVGAKNIQELAEKARFVRITQAGFKESHAHDVTVTKETPNYHVQS